VLWYWLAMHSLRVYCRMSLRIWWFYMITFFHFDFPMIVHWLWYFQMSKGSVVAAVRFGMLARASSRVWWKTEEFKISE
jgi:hypothetical protein